MATITLHGDVTLHTSGELPAIGSTLPDGRLVGMDLKETTLSAVGGKRVLNIFPSIDTGVCATSVRTFNKKAAEKPGVTVLNLSVDLPFAQKRFCGAEGIEKAKTYSMYRGDLASKLGVKIVDGPFEGLCARAVVVVDAAGKVLYTEQVHELTNEPNYDKALAALG